LTVPCESATAATVGIRIAAPAALELTGDTRWRGRSRGVLRLALTAHPGKTGDETLHVRQTYSDGTVANWSPVVHVAAAQNAARDRAVILLVAAAAVAAWLVLRRRGGERT
jgi:hypothetical protein